MEFEMTDIKRKEIFFALKQKSIYESGVACGMDPAWGRAVIKSKVDSAVKSVRNNPERFGVTPQDIEDVAVSIRTRQVVSYRPTLPAKTEEEKVQELDFKDLVLAGRKKAYQVLMKKLDRVSKTNKGIDEINLATLATTFGILFDKSQIAKGEATENVAIMAKVNPNMSPEEALNMVLQMREVNQVDKEKKK